jgi:hypothetical protein
MNSDHLIFNDFERMIRRLSLLRLGKWKISFTIIASKCCSYSFYSLKIKKSFDTTAKCGINQVEKPGEACPTPAVSPDCHPERSEGSVSLDSPSPGTTTLGVALFYISTDPPGNMAARKPE